MLTKDRLSVIPLMVSSLSTLEKIIVSVTFNELQLSSNIHLQSKRVFVNLIITSVSVKTFPLSAFVIK